MNFMSALAAEIIVSSAALNMFPKIGVASKYFKKNRKKNRVFNIARASGDVTISKKDTIFGPSQSSPIASGNPMLPIFPTGVAYGIFAPPTCLFLNSSKAD